MLNVLRGVFIVISALLGYSISFKLNISPITGTIVGMASAGLLVFLELGFSSRFVATITIVMFAVIFGFIISYFVIAALYLIPEIAKIKNSSDTATTFEFCITFLLSFISIIAILHTKDDFKIIIPFVEFSRDKKQGRPLLLDTSAIIDGRLIELADTKIIDTTCYVPKFVLNEIHRLSDSQDKLKRSRGRRALQILNKLRDDRKIHIEIHGAFLPYLKEVDDKLVKLAKLMSARILTTDFNLSRIAQVQGVDVVNVHELAKSLKPPAIQGERLYIEIVKPGENSGQGVGFLEDGTMVVGEGCGNRVGEELAIVITNVIQTTAGRIIFGRPEDSN